MPVNGQVIDILVNKKLSQEAGTGYSFFNRTKGKITYQNGFFHRIGILKPDELSYIHFARLVVKLLFGLITDVLESFCRLIRLAPNLLYRKVTGKIGSSRMFLLGCILHNHVFSLKAKITGL